MTSNTDGIVKELIIIDIRSFSMLKIW